MRKLLALSLIPLAAACASTGPIVPPTRPATASVPPQQPEAQPSSAFRPARVMNMPGLDGVIGSDANGLVRQFGTPRLDVWEDDARKLQFTGRACVLDVFLYPPAPGRTETATWVEARRQTDGRDVDRASCIAALRR
ncbi:hypothetical protein [Croceicoccus bisphenolivorans]|uniref:hypothetical protein n=1 Tax=Croceicoccus bisphenolivorans TaxID=1783232 RepID=UPI00082C39D7|nr:hypothetical protein [Croceicoccus bisphenolivorans]